MSANKAAIIAVLGASGSGKSTYLKRQTAKASRLLVWDPMREYGDLGAATESLAEVAAMLAMPKFRAVFWPRAERKSRERQFDMVCRMALSAGRLVFVAEELKFVTTPSYAPQAWAAVCMTGRHAGLTVYGASQRPASIDKDFFGNCTRIHTGRLVYEADVKAVAETSGIPAESIRALAPLDWLEVDMTTRNLTKGRLTF